MTPAPPPVCTRCGQPITSEDVATAVRVRESVYHAACAGAWRPS